MTKLFVVLLLLFYVTIFVTGESTLRQIHVIFRHGIRTPGKSNSYPKDPYANETWYPYGPGQLTNDGRKYMYDLGLKIRKEYDELLGHIYNPDVVYARSTSYDRTKHSLQLFLAALWPPVTVQQFNTDIGKLWQPVSYDYAAYDEDELLGFPIWSCKEVGDEYRRISSDLIEEFLRDNSKYVDIINENTGLNITRTDQLLDLYIGMKSLEDIGKVKPEWCDWGVYNFLKSASEFEYKIQTSNELIVRESGGPVVKKILNDIENGVENKRKIFIYSAHEYNIAYVLSVLQLYDKPFLPSFGYCILFEVHEIDGKFKIKVFSGADHSKKFASPGVSTLFTILENFMPKKIPGCEELCDLEQFKNITKNYVENQMCFL